MVLVDQQVLFNPFGFVLSDLAMHDMELTGTVYEVNYAHRVFHIVYYIDGVEQRTSFKFSDIGEKVKIL